VKSQTEFGGVVGLIADLAPATAGRKSAPPRARCLLAQGLVSALQLRWMHEFGVLLKGQTKRDESCLFGRWGLALVVRWSESADGQKQGRQEVAEDTSLSRTAVDGDVWEHYFGRMV